MKTEFERELEKLQQFGNTQSYLIGALKDNSIFRECLFDEFKQTPMKKDVSKYLSQFNTDKEKETELNAMIREFYSLIETPKEFYTHDITKTNIYRKFKDIEVVLCQMMETMREPKDKAKIICNIVETLHPEIKKLVIETLIRDNENIYLNSNFVFGNGKRATQNEKDKWEFVKIVFNDKLREYQENLPKGYIGIAEKLSHYIKNATDCDLTYIIDAKQIPPYAKKFEWIGRKSDAIHFCDATKLNVSEFNKCFILQDKSELLHSNRSNADYKEIEIINILKEYSLEKPPILAK